MRASVAADLLASRARTDSLQKRLIVSRLSLEHASSDAAFLRSRALAAESHLFRASQPSAEAAAGNNGLHPLVLSALIDAGLCSSVLSYEEHIGPVRRLHGCNLEGKLCVVTKLNAEAVPVLAAHAARLALAKTRDKYTFHTTSEYLSGLVVSDRHNLRYARRGLSEDAGPEGVGSPLVIVSTTSVQQSLSYRPDFSVFHTSGQ